jgi:putative protease
MFLDPETSNAPGHEAARSSPPPSPNERSRPELLAPAGDWECVRAAVENGADAIYFGLDRFNARMRAQNFTEADLPALMDFLHRRGVKGYVTFNTLVFENEMADAERFLRSIIASGVDAAIVQDVGICRLIRSLSNDFPIHASTQMTISSRAGVEFARRLGCDLVVLARECSLKEIEKIRLGETASSSLAAASQPCLPIEVFVHGALCVAYSGQCLTSESLGGRSANRGECAQACRMPYELICDDKPVPLGDRHYLLSPQDLAGLPALDELVRVGVSSLKIEGRLKSPEYVANITRIYRKALDAILSAANEKLPNGAAQEQWRQSRYDLEMAFSRGLFTGWFGGIDNQKLVHARFGKKRGVLLGAVRSIEREKVWVKLEAPLKAGDGVVFDSGRPDENEEGGRVHEVAPAGESTAIRFGRGDVDFSRVHVGDKLWKTSDPALDQRLRKTFSSAAPQFQRPLEMEIHGSEGIVLTIIARDEWGNVASVASEMPLAAAHNQPLTAERLEEQLGRLGGTPFELKTLKNLVEGSVILPMKELNRMRRHLVEELERLRARPKRWHLADIPSTPVSLQATATHSALSQQARLVVLVRSLEQLEAAIECGVATIYCEFEDPKKYRDAVTHFRASQSDFAHSDSAILVAPPRIFKTGEEWILNQVRSCGADGWLIRNYDHLNFFAEGRRIGDFSLNIANSLSAHYFKNTQGLERVTASYDLNIVQLEALLRAAPPEWFEITIHQHMPMFHMEHCVFCAFLSNGADYRDCGRPCDKHRVQLRDRVGLEHPLKADAGCRNTVFNARAQTGAEYAQRLMSVGARNFRIEFLNESAQEVVSTIVKYRELLEGKITGAQLWRELKLRNQLGVTRGPMDKPEKGSALG